MSSPGCVEPDEPPRRKPWAWLLRHVFLHDVSVCPRCQGPTTWLEVATEPDAIDQAMVDHGGEPTHRPRYSTQTQFSWFMRPSRPVFPGERHGYRSEDVRRYVFRRIIEYLVANL